MRKDKRTNPLSRVEDHPQPRARNSFSTPILRHGVMTCDSISTQIIFRLAHPDSDPWDGQPPSLSLVPRQPFLAVIRSVPCHRSTKVIDNAPYFYDFPTGGRIRIDVYTPPNYLRYKYWNEIRKRVGGMRGYEWLVDSILRYGYPISPEQATMRLVQNGSEKRRKRLGF